MKSFLKILLLYVTAISVLLTLCAVEASTIAFLTLILIDIILIVLCKKLLTLRELIRYSGYDIWYKSLK